MVVLSEVMSLEAVEVSVETSKPGQAEHFDLMSESVDIAAATYAATLGARIRECRGKMSRDEFARQLGLHINTIGKFERGMTMPDAFVLSRIASIGHKSVAWLVTGERENEGVDKSTQAVEHGGYIYVPKFDIKAAAGTGVFNDIELVVAMKPFERVYIRNRLGIPHNHIALIEVFGDSMQPKLHSKDTVLIDLQSTEVRTEGVHVIMIDGALLVKKVQRLPGKTLRVSSENSAYESFDIVGSEDEEIGQEFAVVGRVRWGGLTFD